MRKRSATVTAPIAVGQQLTVQLWQHEPEYSSSDVLFPMDTWPGISRGDVVQVVAATGKVDPSSAFLFVVGGEGGSSGKTAPHISLAREVTSKFSLPAHTNVILTKVSLPNPPHVSNYGNMNVQVNPSSVSATMLEFFVRDMYMGRREMWRLHTYLSGKCIFRGQKTGFYGCLGAVIKDIFVGEKPVCGFTIRC